MRCIAILDDSIFTIKVERGKRMLLVQKNIYISFVREDDFYANEIGKASRMCLKGLIPFTSGRFKASYATLRTYACMSVYAYPHNQRNKCVPFRTDLVTI